MKYIFIEYDSDPTNLHSTLRSLHIVVDNIKKNQVGGFFEMLKRRRLSLIIIHIHKYVDSRCSYQSKTYRGRENIEGFVV